MFPVRRRLFSYFDRSGLKFILEKNIQMLNIIKCKIHKFKLNMNVIQQFLLLLSLKATVFQTYFLKSTAISFENYIRNTLLDYRRKNSGAGNSQVLSHDQAALQIVNQYETVHSRRFGLRKISTFAYLAKLRTLSTAHK